MRRETLGLIGLAGSLSIGVGCTDVDSSDILTSGMNADIHVIADGTGDTSVIADLRVGDSLNYVELTDGDRLTASLEGGSPTELRESVDLFDYHGYSATLPGDASGTVVTVAFERTVDSGAPSSTATIPEPFALGAGPTTASRAADVAFTWTGEGAADPMTITVSGVCIESYTQTLSDTGAYTLPAGSLVALSGSEAEPCDVEAVFQRANGGDLDPAFGDGEIIGEQRRSVGFESTP